MKNFVFMLPVVHGIGKSGYKYQNEAKGKSSGPCHCMKTRRRVLSLF